MKTKLIILTTLLFLFCLGTTCCAEVIEFTPEGTIAADGDYRIEGLYTDILTDASRADGWFYYYSFGTESGVPWNEWKYAPGMYTACELLFSLTELDPDAKQPFSDRFSGVIVFGLPNGFASALTGQDYVQTLQALVSSTPGAEIFPLTLLQENPGQLDSDGYPARSTEAVLLKYNETVKHDLIADVSPAFYQSWENPDGRESMWAFFSYGDGNIYAVDLRTWLEEY